MTSKSKWVWKPDHKTAAVCPLFLITVGSLIWLFLTEEISNFIPVLNANIICGVLVGFKEGRAEAGRKRVPRTSLPVSACISVPPTLCIPIPNTSWTTLHQYPRLHLGVEWMHYIVREVQCITSLSVSASLCSVHPNGCASTEVHPTIKHIFGFTTRVGIGLQAVEGTWR